LNGANFASGCAFYLGSSVNNLANPICIGKPLRSHIGMDAELLNTAFTSRGMVQQENEDMLYALPSALSAVLSLLSLPISAT